MFGYYSVGAFCLSFVSEVGLLLSNSLIVNKLGAGEYANIYFWSILSSMGFYILFSSVRESTIRVFYGLILFVLLVNSILFFQYAESPIILKAFVISFFLMDFIGPNVFSGVLMSNSSPGLFREVFQRILSIQLFARIIGAFSMTLLSYSDLTAYAIYIFWLVLVIHGFCLVRVVYLAHGSQKIDVKPSLNQIRRASTFLFNNHFIRLVLQISILANVIRIFVDYIYLQKVGTSIVGSNQVSAFLSSVSLFTIICVYLFQRLVGKRLVISKNLGMLYSIQPLGVIVFGLSVILVPGIVLPVALMVFAQCSGRGIQLPLFRQSMVALPKDLRNSVMFIISIFLSASGLAVTAILSVTKDVAPPEFLLLSLIAVGILLLLIVTRLDSFYVRNLWSAYKEMREGQWLERRIGHSQSPFHLVTQMSMISLEETQDEDPLEEDRPRKTTPTTVEDHNPLRRLSNILRVNPRSEETRGLLNFCLTNDRISISTKRILLRRVYEACYDKEILKTASEFHKFLLSSDEPKEVLEGIRLSETVGMRRLKRILLTKTKAKDALVVQAAEMAFATETFMETLPTKKLSSITLRKLRSVARDFIEMGEDAKLFTKMEWLLENESDKRIRGVVDILYHPRFNIVREQILTGIDHRKQEFSIYPLIRQMFNWDYIDGHEVRWTLRRIGYAGQRELVFREINSVLSVLLENKFCVWNPEKFQNMRLRNMFLHILFLEEWVDSLHSSVSYFTHTIKDLIHLDGQQKEMLSSIHLEYLKRNASYPIWRVLLSQNMRDADWIRAKRELTNLLVSV